MNTFNSLRDFGINFGEDIDKVINNYKEQFEVIDAKKYRSRIWSYYRNNVVKTGTMMVSKDGKNNLYYNPNNYETDDLKWRTSPPPLKLLARCSCCEELINKKKCFECNSNCCNKLLCMTCFVSTIKSKGDMFKDKDICCSSDCEDFNKTRKLEKKYFYDFKTLRINTYEILLNSYCSDTLNELGRLKNNLITDFYIKDRTHYIENKGELFNYTDLLIEHKNKLSKAFKSQIEKIKLTKMVEDIKDKQLLTFEEQFTKRYGSEESLLPMYRGLSYTLEQDKRLLYIDFVGNLDKYITLSLEMNIPISNDKLTLDYFVDKIRK